MRATVSNADYFQKMIDSCKLSIGMRVGIGNGRDGVIVRKSHWSQGVCVKVDGGSYEWVPYFHVIKR